MQIYIGSIRKYDHDEEKVRLVVEDRSQSTLQADNLTANVPTEKQAFDEWVDTENTTETPTGKVTTEENRVVASGAEKPASKQKAKPKAKGIDELYK